MGKYYLIPYETDDEKKFCDAQPKYVSEFGIAVALASLPVSQRGSTVTAWLREYFVVMVNNDNIVLDSKLDALRLDKDTAKTDLANLGIDTSGISEQPRYEDRDKAVTKWLIGEEKILSEVLNIN